VHRAAAARCRLTDQGRAGKLSRVFKKIASAASLTGAEEKAYEGSPLRKAAHSHGENSIIGLEKVFVPESAGAHSMTNMYG
jgi:hypothetical protein